MGSAASWPSRERRSRERAREATRSETTARSARRTRAARESRIQEARGVCVRAVWLCGGKGACLMCGACAAAMYCHAHKWAQIISTARPLNRGSAASLSARGTPHLYSECLVLSCVLLWHSSNVEHVVAPDQHLAQLARKVAVDPLLGAGQLRAGAGRRTEVSAARARASSSRAHLREGAPAGSCTRRRRLGSPCTPCPI